jgi:transcriptional regulator with XRE-family HTH domain
VTSVRRAIQRALAEEKAKSGMTQSDIARAIGVHRSVISREISGYQDLTLGRVAELAWVMGRTPHFALLTDDALQATNLPAIVPPASVVVNAKTTATTVAGEVSRTSTIRAA